MGTGISCKKPGVDIFETGGGVVLIDEQTPAHNAHGENALKITYLFAKSLLTESTH
jgi:hypothetical protein